MESIYVARTATLAHAIHHNASYWCALSSDNRITALAHHFVLEGAAPATALADYPVATSASTNLNANADLDRKDLTQRAAEKQPETQSEVITGRRIRCKMCRFVHSPDARVYYTDPE